MTFIAEAASGIAAPLFGLIDKLFTSDAERLEAKQKLIALEQAGKLEETRVALSAILAEAQSADPWTSRARPTFLYVVYVLILTAIPMAVVYAVNPDTAKALVDGFHAWLAAIPEPYLTLFGVGYLGYTGTRTFEKVKGVAK